MGVRIGREQRDAIHGEAMAVLTGSGDVWVKVKAGDYDGARATRRRLEDAMRLLDDLGWDQYEPGEEFELTMPPRDLARTLRELNDQARVVLRARVVEPIQQNPHTLRTIAAQAAYGDLLAQLACTHADEGQG